MSDVSGNPDFSSLSEEEQRVIAERLLRVEESGWKPFWCRGRVGPGKSSDRCVTGDPHPLVGPLGLTWVDDSAQSGPNGEPVADYFYDPLRDIHHTALDPTKVWPRCVRKGRVVLDPHWAHNHAREDQRLPSWKKPWTLFIMSGRGTGKTRVGVEFVALCARKGQNGAILGRRGTELINTHVAKILEHAHPEFKPVHWASKDILEWPNGAITYLFSAEKPENIRSINISYVWADEAAFMEFIKTAWMNLKMAARIDDPENPIHYLITSTPTATEWTMEMEDDPTVEVRRVSTYANRANLSKSYLAELERDYEGTRMGRQELHGEVLRDVVGSLWNDSMLKSLAKIDDPGDFIDFCESMDDIVVAVDPAGTANKRSDETGIIAVGSQHSDDSGAHLPASLFYVLADGTIKGTPTEWARQVYKVADATHARRIVAEKNFGADMVLQVLRDFAKTHPDEVINSAGEDMSDFVKEIHATQSKETRAEGTVGKYEQGRVKHVPNCTAYGDLSSLEKEQVTWVPKSRGGRKPSPNRIDALVWAVRSLETNVKYGTVMGSSKSVMEHMKDWTDTSLDDRVRTMMPPTWVPDEPKPAPRPAPEPVVRKSVADIRRFESEKVKKITDYPTKRKPSGPPPGVRRAG